MSTGSTIPGFPFESHYATIDGVKLHYVDEGEGPPILMFHGEPTWSYLYRKMIPPLTKAGFRCVAPDLMGFGMSDKPNSESVYALRRHVELMAGLVDSLKIEGVTIVGQDWGGPIGFRYAIDHQSNVRGSSYSIHSLISRRFHCSSELCSAAEDSLVFCLGEWTYSDKWPSPPASNALWRRKQWQRTRCLTRTRLSAEASPRFIK